MKTRSHSDPLCEMIEAAVERAIQRSMPAILEALPTPSLPDREAPQHFDPSADRFVALNEAVTMIGMHRATLYRYEAVGKLPQRRKLPGGKTGYLLSELRAFMMELPQVPKPVIRPSKLVMSGGIA